MLLQLGPGQALSKSPLKMCGLQPLEVNLGQVTHYSTVQYSTVQSRSFLTYHISRWAGAGGSSPPPPTLPTTARGPAPFPCLRWSYPNQQILLLCLLYCYLTYPGLKCPHSRVRSPPTTPPCSASSRGSSGWSCRRRAVCRGDKIIDDNVDGDDDVVRRMDSLTLLYTDDDGAVVLKTFPQMVVKSCGCR